MRRKVVATGAAALAIVGGGAAYAATQDTTPQAESQAVVEDAAQQLGVDPAKLSSALKKAFEDRVDAAVTAGRLTKAQGDAIKARIEADPYPLLGGPGFGDHRGGPRGGFEHHLAAAATYLGLDESALQTQLQSGKSLADVAKAQGKDVDGLVAALVADEKKELDQAVADSHLTQAQEDAMLANAKQRVTDLVNGTLPPGGGPGTAVPGGPPGFHVA